MSTILQIISSSKGGGAELLVRELHKIYLRHNLDAYAIYLTGGNDDLCENEAVLGFNSRSPLNIFRIRRVLKWLSRNAQGNLIVHAHLTWPFLYVSLAALALPNIKLVYTEHNTTNKRRNIPLFWVLERLLYARFCRIICISRGVESSLAEWVGSSLEQRLVTIPNGSRIYSLVERSSLDGCLPRLVSIGSLSHRKNFCTVINAIAQLRDEIESYTIVGEGVERVRLEQAIKIHNLESKVQLVGWTDLIEEKLHAADIQLIPSLWEGFGLVAVEGMSTGLPVVASNVDGLREVLGESNISVTLVDQPESVDQWVLAIRESIANINTVGANILAQASRQQAEKFTLENMAARYMDVYRQL